MQLRWVPPRFKGVGGIKVISEIVRASNKGSEVISIGAISSSQATRLTSAAC